jgi:uncharacterized membrane protein
MTWSLLLATHAFAASVALPLGGWQLFRSTKGSPVHRLVGRTWVVLMLYVSFTSFWIKELEPGRFSWIHILSLVTILSVSWGLVAAIRGDIQAHKEYMIGSWLGLVGAFVGAVVVPVRHIPTFVVTEPVQAFAAFVAVIITAAAVVTTAKTIAGALPEPVSQRRMAS